jgi:DNA-binding transcriptional LysR family regulator
MEIYQLRTFVTVARLRNVTQAAQVLHLTQSTLSGHLKALESELGVSLHLRASNGVELTAFGHELLAKAQQVLALCDEIRADARQHAGNMSGQIRLAVINDPETIGLGEIMNDMRQRYPDVTIDIRQGLSGWALNEVKSGRRDAGFFIGEVTDPEVRAEQVREIRYFIAGPLAWREQVQADGWAAMGRLPWIWVPPSGSYPGLVTELLARHGVVPRKVVETDRESITQDLASAGVGLCLLREQRARLAEKEGRIFVWEEGTTTAKLSFIYPAARERDPLIQALLDVVRGCIAAA